MAGIDLVVGTALGAAAATVAGTLILGVDRPYRGSLLVVVGLWFAALLVAGGAGLFAVGLAPAVGAAVAIPLIVTTIAVRRSASLRAALRAIPVERLIGVHVVRFVGLSFLILQGMGRLTAPFAPTAGWGDLAAAALAPIVAWGASRNALAWRPAILAWNVFGLLDLVIALALGIASAPGSPLPLFPAEPGTALMGSLPWVLIPTFLVPVLLLTHIAVFRRLAEGATRS
jgi:hypothetical protein